MTGFSFALDRNLEDVDQFYSKKYLDFTRRLKILDERYGSSQDAASSLDKEDREDLLAVLLELRGHFRKLQWYGEVNRRGFVKVTKKLDKKIEGSHAQKKYLALKVDPRAFATNADLFQALEKLNRWLETLSRAADAEGTPGLITSQHKLTRASSSQSLRIPHENFERIEQHIKQDHVAALEDALEQAKKETTEVTGQEYQQFLGILLQKAIGARSRACTAHLLTKVVFLDDVNDINRRNCVHRLVISIGRTHASADSRPTDTVDDTESKLYSFIAPAAAPTKLFQQRVGQEDRRTKMLTRSDEPIMFLQFLLDALQPDHRTALVARDSAGRTPLHFAAEYGVCVMTEIIIEHLQTWNMFDVKEGIDGPIWQDNDGWAPLHLAVIGGHPLTTQALLAAEEWHVSTKDIAQVRRQHAKSSAVLALATKSNFIEVVRILVSALVDLNYQDEQGETALHVAARLGHVECARILLQGTSAQKTDTELREKTYAWTPLFIACVDGQLPIVELLINAGANLEALDSSGWSAKEHAALRGHIALANLLAQVTPTLSIPEEATGLATNSPPRTATLQDRRSSSASSTVIAKPKAGETIKEFGHRYLKDKSMILVSIGTMDMRSRNTQAVCLDRIPMVNASSTQLDTALSIVVSAKGAEGEPEFIDLPVQDNISTEPIVFHAADHTKVKLLFDLVPTYSGNHEKIVGRAVAMLGNAKPEIGAKKTPLQGDLTVPIIASGDLDVIGSITFNFLIITPFSHPRMNITKEQTYWRKVAQTMVIGHRGLGKNFAAGRRSLQLGENTLQSFITAANLGAQYVEFDVQLTKDHVPVIYHDFLVSETGIDAPVHTLTLDQFLHINDSRTPKASRPASPAPAPNPVTSSVKSEHRDTRGRSMSVGYGDDSLQIDMQERMKYTRDFKKKGFKGNSRGNHIVGPFATLAQLFQQLPLTTGFNIEMKYPMLFESQDEDMDAYAVELNSFVDTVLKVVYDLGEGRNIMFSSFHPDICLLLSFKQPSIPVLFLTDAGTSAVGDIRASSLQEAIRFAARWHLLGIVSSSQPLTLAPRLIRVVKGSGLVCVSYGTQNNDEDLVKLQTDQGIDAVIVDSVLRVERGIREEADRKAKAAAETEGKLKAVPVPVIEAASTNIDATANISSNTSEASMPLSESPPSSTVSEISSNPTREVDGLNIARPR